MAINPATGLEDPNYTAPADTTTDTTANTTADTTTDVPDGALGGPFEIGIPEVVNGEAVPDGTDGTDGATTGGALASTADSAVPGLNQTAPGPNGIAAAKDFVSPESTVAGQLERIFQKKSPLQDLAATRAKEQASALGMQSSSAAIGASQRALYDSAMPIAQQDAKTFAEAQAREQTAYNAQAQIDKEAVVAGDLTVQKAEIAQRQQELNDQFQIVLKDMNQEDQVELLELKADFEKQTQILTAELNESLTKLSLDADIEGKIVNQTHDMLNNVQISWQQMLTNDNFLNNFDDRADMLAAMNNLLKPVQASITMTAKQAGVYDDEFSGWLKTLMSESAYV